MIKAWGLKMVLKASNDKFLNETFPRLFKMGCIALGMMYGIPHLIYVIAPNGLIN